MIPVPDTESAPWFRPWVDGWKRPLALPVYKFWPYDDLPPWEPGEPDEHGNVCCGRIVLWGDACYNRATKEQKDEIGRIKREIAEIVAGGDPYAELLADLRGTLRELYHEACHPREPIPRESWGNVCETDVVYVPLFAGVDDAEQPPVGRGRGFGERLTDLHDENLEALRVIAPQAKAVILGNLFSEMAWADYESPTNRCDFEWWQTEVRCHKFMRPAAQLVREAGGRPAFAPVPYEIQVDAFHANRRLRGFFLELDALFVSFNCDTLVTDFHKAAMQADPDGWKRKYPYEQFGNYFGPLDCIGGCDWGEVNESDWDQILHDHGVKAIC